jgi:hypothetical protein
MTRRRVRSTLPLYLKHVPRDLKDLPIWKKSSYHPEDKATSLDTRHHASLGRMTSPFSGHSFDEALMYLREVHEPRAA